MDKKSSVAETDLVDALRNGEASAFEELYARYFKMAASFVQKNQGSDDDARDIFQETLFILVKKLRQADFQLTAKLGTYLYSIIRHLWLKRLKKKGRFQLAPQDDQEEKIAITDNEIEVKEQFERKHELMADVLETLKEDCRKIILKSFYEKRSHKEIAEIMGYTAQFVRVKLHRCMERFRKQVRSHPDFENVID